MERRDYESVDEKKPKAKSRKTMKKSDYESVDEKSLSLSLEKLQKKTTMSR